MVSPSNFVVFAFSDYKNLHCPLFFITKFCSVRFLALQKFTVSPFFIISSCNTCFFITKWCSTSFLKLQTFIMSTFSENKCVYWYLSCNVLDSDEVHGDVFQCFTGVEFIHIALYHSVPVPSFNYVQE